MIKKAQLVFIPGPGLSHLVSIIEIAKLLVHRDHGLYISVLIMKLPFDSTYTTYTNSLASPSPFQRISFIHLPSHHHRDQVSSHHYGPTFLSSLVETQKPHVKQAVADLIAQSESDPDLPLLAAFVIDMFCTSMIDVANEFEVPTYMFYTSSAAFLGLKLHLQSLHDDYNQDITQFKDSDAELIIPSFRNPVPAKVLPSPVLTKEGCAMVFGHARRTREVKGILVNTFLELEAHAINSSSDDGNIPPVYAVGPILETDADTHRHRSSDIIKWLDRQPPSSVVFLCFGSKGTFEEDQVKEIAKALEKSGHRFVWSLRQPPTKDGEKLEEILPEGFLDRSAGKGKVIGWAPQVAILSHAAIGGFVSHCGWNSILESIWCGVAVAAWPMYAEQQVNAFEMVKELGLAAEIKMEYRRGGKMVTAEEIERGIRGVMDGESEVRKRAKEMKDKSRKTVVEAGTSYASLGRFISQIRLSF